MASHLFLDLRGCQKGAISNANFLRESLREILKDSPPIIEYFHQFSPEGVSGVIRTQNYSLSIHTWPEYNYAAIDILCYGDEEGARLIAQQIIERLKASHPVLQSLNRDFDEL